ncbi:hypothetical protein M4951_02295 [Blastopirellula sp. J2-11]|uniref:hypothetical protein n=1 Tax=Blastopirellula sp. J2-11 TaxID=2943192 RepID=UPI0021C7120A|nr:hypothetical protein [Blastopirellula sp. J2-11]UUO07151.1 hypothetical protein M4951_02295 [Blastopirellula sp. J2-11]
MFKISSLRVPLLLVMAALVGNAVATSPLLDPPKTAEELGQSPTTLTADETAAVSPSIQDSASLDLHSAPKFDEIVQAESSR